MLHKHMADISPPKNQKDHNEEILTEQVRQLYTLSPFGFIATLVNATIVFFIMQGEMPYRMLAAWFAAIISITMLRIALVLKYRSTRVTPADAHTWGKRFIAGLALNGAAWGSIGLLPFSAVSLAHQVFLAFVLGGMAAGAAATFSARKEGYLAFSIPALVPLVIRFLLAGDQFHYAMGGMIFLFGFLLWKVSQYNYQVNMTSLLLRFENIQMIDRLQCTKEETEELNRKLLAEIDAKQRVEAELRNHRDQLEKLVAERTSDLKRTNEQLRAEIIEREQAQEIIRQQTYYDPLTGLPNKALFMDRLDLETAQAKRLGRMLAVFFIDLDRFKQINDSLGHAAGDLLIRQVAERLSTCIRENDTLARIGADEFTMILPLIAHTDDTVHIAEKILALFQEPFTIDHQTLHITASIGISMYPHDGRVPELLLKNADIAMYHAKEEGRNNFQFFDAALNLRAIERLLLENRLRESIDRGELVVYYQPQIDISTRQIVCAEALVRWQHPELGLLKPQQFIPTAEETGLITKIDEWMLRTVCSQIMEWSRKGLASPCISVNLSARQFQHGNVARLVADVLSTTGADPKLLSIEITETIAMHDTELTARTLAALISMGIHVAIDDFGTGYSALSYLKQLPLHKIKIDQSFIKDLTRDADYQAIVAAVIGLAHTLKLRVLAEGVESEEQLEFLRLHNCDEIQGNIFSAPLPAEEFIALLETHSTR